MTGCLPFQYYHAGSAAVTNATVIYCTMTADDRFNRRSQIVSILRWQMMADCFLTSRTMQRDQCSNNVMKIVFETIRPSSSEVCSKLAVGNKSHLLLPHLTTTIPTGLIGQSKNDSATRIQFQWEFTGNPQRTLFQLNTPSSNSIPRCYGEYNKGKQNSEL